jgi:hypothetical protein
MRTSRTLLALVAGALSSASVYAGPPPPPGKSPPISAQTELELVRVERIDNTTLTAGAVLPLNVVIANRGTVNATVAAGVATTDTNQGVLRSGSTILAAGQEKKLRVNVPITPRGVRREQLSLHVVIADPKKPASGNALQQLFKDSNLGNNSKNVAYPVRVDLYDVSVVWKQLVVTNDCNPGDATGNWKLSFEIGNLNATDAVSGTGRYNLRQSYLPRPGSTFHWPGSGYRTVSTGQTIALHEKLSRMTSVPKQRHLAIDVNAHRETPPFSYQSGIVGWIAKTLPPATWNFGTTWRGSPVDVGTSGSSSSRPHDQCGHSPYIVELQITTAPTLVI